MRASFFPLLTVLLVLSCVSYAGAQTSASDTFAANLSLGSRNAQVIVLQQVLNRNPDTRVASTGPGSPGNETSYFGSLTKAAVIRFQEKYASEVLTPAGLSQGSGYVGPYTRSKLNALSALVPSTGSVNSVVAPSIATSTTASQNPNLQNLDLYVATIEKDGLKQGLSAETLSLIEEKIRTEAATTTDFRQQFFDNQKVAYEKKVSENVLQPPLVVFLEKILFSFDGTFSAEKAYAAAAVPFGGYITYINPAICDCPPGIITQIFVALPDVNIAESNLLLNYVNGSEAFSWHNIPEPSIAVLGMYVPGVPSCWTYIGHNCVVVPAEGQITPMVGSSLAP